MEHVCSLMVTSYKYLLDYVLKFIIHSIVPGPVMLDEFVEWLKMQRGEEAASTETRGS